MGSKRNAQMRTDTMTPDPANPNRLDDDAKAGLARSLAEFGDLSGVVINRRTGLLIGGHQRADVLRDAVLTTADLPAAEPDGTVARGHLEHLGRRYAVRVVDWDADRAHAALLAANRYGRLGADDAAALKDLLAELDCGQATDTGALLADLTGFDAAERERLAGQVHVDADDYDAPPPPTCKVSFPPRVWLVQRTEITAALQQIVDQFGGVAEWPE